MIILIIILVHKCAQEEFINFGKKWDNYASQGLDLTNFNDLDICYHKIMILNDIQ